MPIEAILKVHTCRGGLSPGPAGKGPAFWANTLAFYAKNINPIIWPELACCPILGLRNWFYSLFENVL